MPKSLTVLFALLVSLPLVRVQRGDATLVGWAVLPVNTFAAGPTSGQFAGRGQFGNTLPLVDKQPVQGFSAVIPGPASGTFYVLADNGFGTKANSADALLRVYAVRPDFRTRAGGAATVSAADFRTGAALPSFTPAAFITLDDGGKQVGFPIVADAPTYGSNPGSPAVPEVVRSGRLLTGADFDPESFRKDRNGDFWFGDEFGPFLLRTDPAGRVRRKEIPATGLSSPENPYLAGAKPTLASSRGFEGLATNGAGDMLYALVEGTVAGDPPGTLRILEFSVATESFTGKTWRYSLDPAATNIGDMTRVADGQFLVIERNGAAGLSAQPAPFKKIFLVDTTSVDAAGAVKKTEIVDLMQVADPDDLDRDGSTTFTFPYVTIEDVLVLDRDTILVINDNNYPGGGGRGPFSDRTEFILLRLVKPLP